MKPYLIALGGMVGTGFILVLIALTHGQAFPILIPSGSIGQGERDMMYHAVFLMLIVVVPVVILAIFVAWHYREGNRRASYTPNWEQSRMEELIWWSIPFEIVLVLSALTWTGTHELDPSKSLAVTTPPVTVEVVALPWKWLFIYPSEGIASLNEVVLPVNRPVEFHITADAPMNSFWIPALGGQMYAMTGMTTVLHLIATTVGDYPGRSANYSGEGFAQMKFTARAVTQANYDAWVASAKASPDVLSKESYALLRKPGDTGPVRYYGVMSLSFADIVNSYMSDMHESTPSLPTPSDMKGMKMSPQ